MKLEIHAEAGAEIRRHHEWYERRDPRVAARLADLFETTIVRIATAPQSFPLMEMDQNPGNIRRARLTGFPIIVLYRVTPDRVEVIAVPHTSQRPDYWRSRLAGP